MDGTLILPLDGIIARCDRTSSRWASAPCFEGAKVEEAMLAELMLAGPKSACQRTLLWRIQPAPESTPASIAAIKRVEASRTTVPDIQTFPDALLWDGIFRAIHRRNEKVF
jgi:hypothetical protein